MMMNKDDDAAAKGPMQVPISPNGDVTVQFQGSQISVGAAGDGARVGLSGSGERPEVFYQSTTQEGTVLQGGLLDARLGDFGSSINMGANPYGHHMQSDGMAGVSAVRDGVSFLNRDFNVAAATGVTFDAGVHARISASTQHSNLFGTDARATTGVEVSYGETDGARLDLREDISHKFETPWGTKAEAGAAVQATFSERRGTSYTASTDLDVRLGSEGSLQSISAVFGAHAGSEDKGASIGVFKDVGIGRAGVEVNESERNGTSIGLAFKAPL